MEGTGFDGMEHDYLVTMTLIGAGIGFVLTFTAMSVGAIRKFIFASVSVVIIYIFATKGIDGIVVCGQYLIGLIKMHDYFSIGAALGGFAAIVLPNMKLSGITG